MHAQSCPTLCYLMDCSLPGSSVHGVLQARILEWAVIFFSRGSFWFRDWTHVSWVSCIIAGFFTAEPSGKLCSSINMYIYCFSKYIISLMAETIPNSLLTSSIGLGILCSGNSECLVNMNVLLKAQESLWCVGRRGRPDSFTKLYSVTILSEYHALCALSALSVRGFSGGGGAAAKSLQSCPTLCDPIGGSPPGSPIPGILQARTLEWVAISFSNAWKWKVKVKSLSSVQLSPTPWTAAYQAPPSMGISRQEYWSGVPLPSPQLVLVVKNPPANAGDIRDGVLIPGLGRSPGKNMCFWDHVRYFAPGGRKRIRSGQKTFSPKKSSIEREWMEP